MSNDLQLSDIKVIVENELNVLKKQLLEQSQNDKITTSINYKAVCQYLDYSIFEFVWTSQNPEVKAFGQKLIRELSQKFGITERI
jgi:hypothetical protein